MTTVLGKDQLAKGIPKPVAEATTRSKPAARRRGEDLSKNLLWLIHLRWFAVAGVCLALVGGSMTGWVADLEPPLLVALGLAVFNTWLWLGLREQPSTGNQARMLFVQLQVDLAALTLLLYWTGGIENPFALFYFFPTALASVLLSRRSAIATGISTFVWLTALTIASSLTGTTAPMLEGKAPLPLDNPVFIAAMLAAVLMTLGGVVYFIQSVVEQERRTEHQRRKHETVARSRERLARIGKISAGLAHSIRNPLHGILNCIDLVRESVDDPATNETLDLMDEGLHRIDDVTKRLLVLTRESPLALVRGDLNEVVAETVRLFEVRLSDRAITLHMDLQPMLPVDLDPNRMHEALFNILDNALGACADQASGDIRVETEVIKAPVPGAGIAVTDTGSGIEAALLEQIYDPFFTTKAIGQGSGLGLAIAKRVVEAHGGNIEITSEVGQGTRVAIFLPRCAPTQHPGGVET